jgi:peptide/nickel transport system substrate-binding protein
VTERRDQLVVTALILALVMLGGALALPSTPDPGAAPVVSASPTAPPLAVYREGLVGRPESITPVTAANRADRTIVGLVFSGLVRLGPGTSIEPDLATRWDVSDDGLTWTFQIRDDARWHDGTPVTAADVAYTVRVLRSPELAGPAAASWAEVTATAVDEKVVRFTLKQSLGGFLEAATQPLLPAHLLADVPASELVDHPFSRLPVGTGPFMLTALRDDVAILQPAALLPVPPPQASGPPVPTDSLATDAPPPTPPAPVPYIDRIEIRFYEDTVALADALRAGEIHTATGIPPADAAILATETGADILRYPSTTLSAVVFDLRPGHAELRDVRVHRALLMAIDRRALIAEGLAGAGILADALVPPSSWAYDAAEVPGIEHDPASAAALLVEAGWVKGTAGWTAPGTTEAYELEVLTPPADTNPGAAGLAEGVVAAWRELGFAAQMVELPPGELVARLRSGEFTAAVVDMSLGLDPDLYPILASTQVAPRGGNVAGLQDRKLDALLASARAHGSGEERAAAWRDLLVYLGEMVPILPLAWRTETVLSRGVDGVTPRLMAESGDRFWDVLAWRLAAGR